MADSTEISYGTILLDSLPLMLSNTLEIIIMTINLHYATDNVMVAGLGLSMILVHSLGGSLLYGFNTGYSTYASRAFGAKNKAKFNSYCVQGLLNLGILLVVLTIFGFLTYKLCVITGQEEGVAEAAHQFYVWQLPGFWCFFLADFLKSMLNAQAIFQQLTYTNVATCVFHILISSVLSRSYGFYGIVLSTNLTFLVFLLLVVGTMLKYGQWQIGRDTFNPNDWHEGYRQFFRECMYVALPTLLDLFMFEFMALYVGSYKIVQQTAAHISFSNMVMVNGGIISGYSTACMIKAGHQAGMNNPDGLRLLIHRGVKITMASFFLQYSTVCIFHNQIFGFYSQDEGVLSLMLILLPVYFVYGIFDSLMFIGSNLFRALKFGAWMTRTFTLSYYGVGGLTLVVLTFLMENKVLVAWLGFMAGSQAITLFMWLKSRQLDLDQISKALHEEVKREESEVPLQDL